MSGEQCQICLSNLENPVNYCTDESHESFCKSCVTSHITCKITEAFMGTCPLITCPSASHRKKKKILVYDKWRKAVKAEVLTKHSSLASSLLAFLCGGCHALKTLDVGSERDKSAPCYKELEKLLTAADGSSRKALFEQHIAAYCSGDVSLDDAYDEIIHNYLLQISAMSDYDAWGLFVNVLKTIDDPERRVNLHLRYLRDRPRIKTLCCSREHCFRCKIKDFHEGKTCIETVESLDHSIVLCPSCGITLAKGDGCNTVTCVCGKQFSWTAEKEITERCHSFLRLFPVDTSVNCANMLCSGCTTFELQQAKAWQTRHRLDVNRAIKHWFKTKYWPCPSQCCTILPLDSMPEGVREAVELWRHDHSSEVEKCKVQNAIALSSIFLSYCQREEDRPVVANRIIYYSRRPNENAVDPKLAQSAIKWVEANREKYIKGLEDAEERSAQQFLFIYGSKPVSSVKPAYVSSQSPQEWSRNISNPELTYSNDNTTVERVGSVSCYPAAFANLVSERSSFRVSVDSAPKSSNWLTFGLARAGMQTSSSDGVGRTSNTWGISDDRSSSSVNALVSANGSEVGSFRKLRAGDILCGLVDTVEGWFELSINDQEYVHRFEIPPGSTDDYWFAMTFANDHRVSIIYEPMPLLKSPSHNAGELNPEHTVMYTNLRKYIKRLIAFDDTETGKDSNILHSLDDGSAWLAMNGGEDRIAMEAFEQLKPSILELLTLPKSKGKVQKKSELDITWKTLAQAVSWYAQNKETIRAEKQIEMALNFKEIHCDDAAFIAATSLLDYYSNKHGGEDQQAAVAYMNFFCDEINEWYDFDYRSKDPIIENVAKTCRCLPRHLRSCPLAKSK